jgi:cytochrome P460
MTPKEGKGVRKYLGTALVLAALIGVGAAVFQNKPVAAQAKQSQSKPTAAQAKQPGGAQFTPDGKMKLPTGYREWVFLGSPLTPNALNGGKASFPEFHNVYVERRNFDAYQKTGDFPEGTVLVKELVLLQKPTFPDGSQQAPSGRGYFDGNFNCMDVSVKDTKKYAKTNGWGYYTFGHHPEPCEATAAEKPVAECAGCHIANVAKTDMTYVQFYPVLHEKGTGAKAK